MMHWACSTEPLPDPHGRAAKLLAFVDLLRHPKSERDDKRLDLAPFWRRILARIYGPSDENGRRQVRTAFIMIPRGARKSTTAGVIALAHTVGPFRAPNSLVVSAGVDREQAGLAFGEAAAMLGMDELLLPRAKVRAWENRIVHAKSRAEYRAVSADADSQLGKSPAVVVADELCAAWRGRQALDLWGALKTGTAKVPDSLTIIISTAGDGRDQALGLDLYRYAKRVESGEVIDPSFLPVIFEAPADLPWDDEATWRLANPGLDLGFPDISALRDSARMAKELPAFRRQFEQLHLNRWQDGTAAGWVDMAVWDEGAAPIDVKALAGRTAWLGVDLSKSFDLTAVVVVLRDDGGGYVVLPFCFLPADTVRARAANSTEPWREWEAAGHLIVTPGSVQDEDAIEAKIVDLCTTFDVREIAFDPRFGGRIMTRLSDDGFPVVEHAQTALHYTDGITEFQRAVLDRKLRHGGHPVLRWCVQNVTPVVGDTGLVRFSKKRSADAIDAAQAAAMAIGRAMHGDGGTIYGAADFKIEDVLFG